MAELWGREARRRLRDSARSWVLAAARSAAIIAEQALPAALAAACPESSGTPHRQAAASQWPTAHGLPVASPPRRRAAVAGRAGPDADRRARDACPISARTKKEQAKPHQGRELQLQGRGRNVPWASATRALEEARPWSGGHTCGELVSTAAAGLKSILTDSETPPIIKSRRRRRRRCCRRRPLLCPSRLRGSLLPRQEQLPPQPAPPASYLAPPPPSSNQAD